MKGPRTFKSARDTIGFVWSTRPRAAWLRSGRLASRGWLRSGTATCRLGFKDLRQFPEARGARRDVSGAACRSRSRFEIASSRPGTVRFVKGPPSQGLSRDWTAAITRKWWLAREFRAGGLGLLIWGIRRSGREGKGWLFWSSWITPRIPRLSWVSPRDPRGG